MTECVRVGRLAAAQDRGPPLARLMQVSWIPQLLCGQEQRLGPSQDTAANRGSALGSGRSDGPETVFNILADLWSVEDGKSRKPAEGYSGRSAAPGVLTEIAALLGWTGEVGPVRNVMHKNTGLILFRFDRRFPKGVMTTLAPRRK